MLENLEKVMPPRVHLESITPQLDEDNQLGLKMMVAGDSRDRALELARRMEASQRFSHTEIITEHFLQSTNGDTEQVEIAAIYIQLNAPPPLRCPHYLAEKDNSHVYRKYALTKR